MRFFFDTCITKRIVRALRELSERQSITHLEEMFSADMPDVDWIRELRQHGDWVIVSGDQRITRSPAEKAAWMESGLTGFFFDNLAQHGFWIQVREVVQWWPTIYQTARDAPPGTGYLIKFKAKELRVIYEPRR